MRHKAPQHTGGVCIFAWPKQLLHSTIAHATHRYYLQLCAAKSSTTLYEPKCVHHAQAEPGLFPGQIATAFPNLRPPHTRTRAHTHNHTHTHTHTTTHTRTHTHTHTTHTHTHTQQHTQVLPEILRSQSIHAASQTPAESNGSAATSSGSGSSSSTVSSSWSDGGVASMASSNSGTASSSDTVGFTGRCSGSSSVGYPGVTGDSAEVWKGHGFKEGSQFIGEAFSKLLGARQPFLALEVCVCACVRGWVRGWV